MKESVLCPNCHSEFLIDRKLEGKKAKCAKCNQPFAIKFGKEASINPPDPSETPIPSSETSKGQLSPPPPKSYSAPTPPSPPVRTDTPTSSLAGKKSIRTSVSVPLWSMVLIPAIVSFIVGYFAGRENVKYQIQSSFANAFGQMFSSNSKSDRDDESKSTPSASNGVDLDSLYRDSLDPRGNGKTVPRLNLGETYQGDGFTFTIQGASIGMTTVKNMFGGNGTGKNPDLSISIAIQNTDDRKILVFREANRFLSQHFSLRDDVENVIRGVDYGATSKPIGALSGGTDILPGQLVGHVELFTIPPPKTKFLILTVDLACVGSADTIEVSIPVDLISRQ
jgi:predicted Zn finger-like uncharacterized protein